MARIRCLELTTVFAVALAGTTLGHAGPDDPTLIWIESGAIRGVTAGDVISFKGIPYAAPPIGELRWRMPQPVKPWQGLLPADKFGPACMQTDDVPKSEECLTLNVWRPAAVSSSPLAVMVWIHGGGLVQGRTSLYPLDEIARQSVVAVSMNYRLGRLGFFAHPALAAEAPNDLRGNYGHMDQRAALQWIQRNIGAFGGDPNKVTIFGESAGGGSVMVHLTSPLSVGLFHGAILQSPGVPTARRRVLPLTELADAERVAVDYARSVGITGEDSAALEALRALPAEKLTEGTSIDEEIPAFSAGEHVAGFAGAIRDGKLIVEEPEATFAAGRQNMVPVMIGANDRDLAMGRANSKDDLFAIFGPYAAEARKGYDPHGEQALAELREQIFADRTMIEPSRHLADEMARAGQPAWLYRFAYVSQARRGTDAGALHASEIPFAMNMPAAGGDAVTQTDRAMARIVSGYWVQFGRTGAPNGGGQPFWPRHDPAIDRILHFTNSGLIVGTDPLKPKLDLWQKVWSHGRQGSAPGANHP